MTCIGRRTSRWLRFRAVWPLSPLRHWRAGSGVLVASDSRIAKVATDGLYNWLAQAGEARPVDIEGTVAAGNALVVASSLTLMRWVVAEGPVPLRSAIVEDLGVGLQHLNQTPPTV